MSGERISSPWAWAEGRGLQEMLLVLRAGVCRRRSLCGGILVGHCCASCDGRSL